jgi:hypothetical protein
MCYGIDLFDDDIMRCIFAIFKYQLAKRKLNKIIAKLYNKLKETTTLKLVIIQDMIRQMTGKLCWIPTH